MTRFFTTQDGTRLAYDLQGQGKPLLCLAGLTRNRDDFNHVLPHLSGVQILRMDYRGRGDSAWTGAATYSVLQEAQDALALLDHLNIARTAILGTSRGGLIGMVLAQLAKPRLMGLCLNDIGPVIERAGLERIGAYVGQTPQAPDLDTYALNIAAADPGFADVPRARWLSEAANRARPGPAGLTLRYDPDLRLAFQAGLQAPPADLWPLFDACHGLPLALIRGQNSDLLSLQTATEMQRRRPDLIWADVPGRGHVPFLDEPESLDALTTFIKALP